jgi:hypothetical protein
MTEIDLLRCLFHTIARATIPQNNIREVVAARSKNRVKAYNLFDGTRTIQEVAKAAKIDPGNLSRSASSWVKSGFLFWVGDGEDARLLHIYPIPEKAPKVNQ